MESKMDLGQIKKDYIENGWVVVDNVFTTKEMDEVLNKTIEVSEKEVLSGEIHTLDSSHDGKTLSPRKINNPYLKDELFQSVLKKDNLQKVLSALLKDETPVIGTTQIFMKPPYHGTCKPYHQDNSYFKCSPADELITAWIAFEDVDEANGCLRYINGSHKGEIVEHHVVPEATHDLKIASKDIDYSKERSAIVKKGGVVFHHGGVMHTSLKNTSSRWRRAYATHWYTKNVTSESNFLENAYCKPEELCSSKN